MKKTLAALIALTALAAACHERRSDAPPDYGAVRAHSNAADDALQREQPFPPSNTGK